jgi:hypothetical protein
MPISADRAADLALSGGAPLGWSGSRLRPKPLPIRSLPDTPRTGSSVSIMFLRRPEIPSRLAM